MIIVTTSLDRIAAHYQGLTAHGRAADWSLEGYLGAVLAVESNARAESVARQRIRYAGLPAIKTMADFDFTAQPALDHAQRVSHGTRRRRNDLLASKGERRVWGCGRRSRLA